MLKSVYVIAALALFVGVASLATAQDSSRFAAAIRATAASQYGGVDWQPGSDWNRDIDVRCASQGYNYNMCQVDTGRGSQVQIVRQISKTRCVEGNNWGWNRAGIWVDKGCEGIFRVGRRWQNSGPGSGPGPGPGSDNGGWQPGAGWDTAIRVRCASQGYQYNMCQVDTGRGSAVRIERQISKTRCVQGRTWGWNRAGIWVDGGCEAIFRVDRRWR